MMQIKDMFVLTCCVFTYNNVKSRLFYIQTIVTEVPSSEKVYIGSTMYFT
jgi:hypothetical protein